MPPPSVAIREFREQQGLRFRVREIGKTVIGRRRDRGGRLIRNGIEIKRPGPIEYEVSASR